MSKTKKILLFLGIIVVLPLVVLGGMATYNYHMAQYLMESSNLTVSQVNGKFKDGVSFQVGVTFKDDAADTAVHVKRHMCIAQTVKRVGAEYMSSDIVVLIHNGSGDGVLGKGKDDAAFKKDVATVETQCGIEVAWISFYVRMPINREKQDDHNRSNPTYQTTVL